MVALYFMAVVGTNPPSPLTINREVVQPSGPHAEVVWVVAGLAAIVHAQLQSRGCERLQH